LDPIPKAYSLCFGGAFPCRRLVDTDGRQADGRGPQTVPDWLPSTVACPPLVGRVGWRDGDVTPSDGCGGGGARDHRTGAVNLSQLQLLPCRLRVAVAEAAAATGNGLARVRLRCGGGSVGTLQFAPRDGRRWRRSWVWTAANDSPTGTV